MISHKRSRKNIGWKKNSLKNHNKEGESYLVVSVNLSYVWTCSGGIKGLQLSMEEYITKKRAKACSLKLLHHIESVYYEKSIQLQHPPDILEQSTLLLVI